jgi:uncharacterized protein YbjT (DUF2867 family)
MRTLVLGGTGMLGFPVVQRLAADGHQVRVLSRRPAAAEPRLTGLAEVCGGDVEDPAALSMAMAGCDAVHVSLDGHGDWDLERRGAAAVAAAARSAGVQRITLISGASAFPENAWFPMTKAKLAAEEAIRASGVPHTILRCTMFMETLPNLVRDGRAMVMGRQPHPWHWVAAEDFARLVSRALALPEAAGRTLYVYGPQALTMEQAVETYRRLCAPHAKLTRVPFLVLQLLALSPKHRELKAVGLPIMRYFSKVHETADPAETNALLGAPATTLEAWCRARAGAST